MHTCDVAQCFQLIDNKCTVNNIFCERFDLCITVSFCLLFLTVVNLNKNKDINVTPELTDHHFITRFQAE